MELHATNPKESYNPYREFMGGFVFVHPPNTNIYLMWICLAFVVVQLDDIILNVVNFKFSIGRPSKGKTNLEPRTLERT